MMKKDSCMNSHRAPEQDNSVAAVSKRFDSQPQVNDEILSAATSSRWHTDRKVGEVAVLPNGTKIRVGSIRGRRVRIEYVDPPRAAPAASSSGDAARKEGR